ncbi:hypothetical protein SFC79_02435 [Nocardioides sp. S-58]|uniref:Uncharacterized protein n=1 Tax=Nocardioides renjunii TaxID=3095075 RepID=A0ABU5K809_9ACTN|nr:hypothetical protein [Nocardioides sp. S-58]MDZ5660609.1 hypothetical protein [Nocardioides sp. S-58]
MSDDRNDETQPVRPEQAAPEPAPTDPPLGDGGGGRGFRERFRRLRSSDRGRRDRTFGLAALIASALAGIIVGGLGFAAVHAIGDDGGRDRGGWMQQREADDRGPGRGGMPGGPRGVPGQLPPTTPPEDEGSTS